MPPNIGSMVSGNPGPAQRPPAVSGPKAQGAGDHTVGKLTQEPCADGLLKAGGAKMVSAAGVAGVSSSNIGVIAQGPGLLGQMSDIKPTSKAKPSLPGDAGNVSSGAGISDDKPAAGFGPGQGRQPAQAGVTKGKTLARPRGSSGGFLPSK